MAYKTVVLEMTIEGAVSDAFSDLESLRDEMTDWRDAMEDKLSHTDKYSQVSDTADALDVVDNTIDVPAEIQGVAIQAGQMVNRNKRKGCSRSVRCSNVGMLLEAAKEGAEVVLTDGVDEGDEELPELLEEDIARGERMLLTAELRQAIEQFVDEVSELIDNLSGLEFPGMYG